MRFIKAKVVILNEVKDPVIEGTQVSHYTGFFAGAQNDI